jgi:hypothetical protein
MSKEVASDHPLFGATFYHGRRRLTIGNAYVGHGPDDPSGYDYTFDDQPNVTHWISTGALPIRFTREPTND